MPFQDLGGHRGQDVSWYCSTALNALLLTIWNGSVTTKANTLKVVVDTAANMRVDLAGYGEIPNGTIKEFKMTQSPSTFTVLVDLDFVDDIEGNRMNNPKLRRGYIGENSATRGQQLIMDGSDDYITMEGCNSGGFGLIVGVAETGYVDYLA